MIIFFLFLNQSIYFLVIKIWNLLPQNSISNIYCLPHFRITFSQQRETIKHWMSLPGEVVWSLTLEIFKTRQNNAVSNLVKPCNWPCFQQEDGWYPEVPSRLNYFMIPQALRHSSEPKPLTSALLIQWNNRLAGSGNCKKEILSFILFFGPCFSV